ncbi:RNA-dependent RNA polymerase 1, partial [Stegodyphus mimosarum]
MCFDDDSCSQGMLPMFFQSLFLLVVRLALIKHSGATEHGNHYKPSAFQIRYKGCKGMIAEIPDICGRSIGIRPSMIKFECYSSDQLEIVKTSGPRRLYLNKHLITILE